MSFTNTEIKEIAWLARLSLDENEIPAYHREIGKILNLVEQLQAVDSGGIVPLAHPLDIPARLRPDEITETNQRDKFQEIAPAVDQGHYLVPRVIE